jgi:hypothetical protein
MRASGCAVAACCALAWASSSVAGAPEPTKTAVTACSLISAAQLTAALGGEVGGSHSSDTPYTKGAMYDHDGVTHMCGLSVGGRSVTVTYTTHAVTAEGREAYETRMARWEGEMREKGADVTVEDKNGSRCVAVTSGKAESVLPAQEMVHCATIVGDYSVSVSVSSAKTGDTVPVEKVRALLDVAGSKLR